MKMGDRIVGLIVTAILLIVLVSTLYPFWHVLVVSLNDPLDTIRGGLGLLNNFWVYILPHLATAFNTIIVRTYIFASRNERLSTLQFELQKRLTSAMALMEQGQMSSGRAVAQMQDTSRITTPQAVRAAMTMLTTVPIILVYPFL
jgi:ABC-type glycerol-3-phosphate transport system permease component